MTAPAAAPVDPVNTASVDRVRASLLTCADIPGWADGLIAGRPYPDGAALLAAADAAARAWTSDEVEQALAQHPRIGERSAAGGREAALSAGEQSGVGTDDDLARRLREGNERYEERFGRVFLIRARGRSGPEVLAALEQRLGADDDAERETVRDELRQIAVLRLEGLLAHVADTGDLP